MKTHLRIRIKGLANRVTAEQPMLSSSYNEAPTSLPASNLKIAYLLDAYFDLLVRFSNFILPNFQIFSNI